MYIDVLKVSVQNKNELNNLQPERETEWIDHL